MSRQGSKALLWLVAAGSAESPDEAVCGSAVLCRAGAAWGDRGCCTSAEWCEAACMAAAAAAAAGTESGVV